MSVVNTAHLCSRAAKEVCVEAAAILTRICFMGLTGIRLWLPAATCVLVRKYIIIITGRCRCKHARLGCEYHTSDINVFSVQ